MNLAGALVAAVTPFDPVTGEIDVVGMRSNIRWWTERDAFGIVIGGSTGEAVLLDEEERRLLLEAGRGAIPGDRLLVAGAGAESTRATLRLCRIASDAGADAVLVMPPAFYKGAMTPEALSTHYRRVADESALPVIVYQVPTRLNTIELPVGLVAELSRHENIVGIKDSRGSLEVVGELVSQCREGFQVLVGSGAQLYGSLEVGAVGGILGVSNAMPQETSDLIRVFREGRTQEAGRLQELIGPVHKVMVGEMGVAGVKAGLDMMGLRGGDPRPPLRPLPEKRRAELRGVLETAGLLRQGEVREPVHG
jgi:4-hydroxy-2-oxoglutarate aldolase